MKSVDLSTFCGVHWPRLDDNCCGACWFLHAPIDDVNTDDEWEGSEGDAAQYNETNSVACRHIIHQTYMNKQRISVLSLLETTTPWSIKTCHFYFSNSSMQHWPILINFGLQHQEETWCKWLHFWPPHSNTVATLPCKMQVVEPAVCKWCQRLPLAFSLEEDILSTCCNKENVMWHMWLFEITTVCLPIVFVLFQSIISEPTRALSSIKSLL